MPSVSCSIMRLSTLWQGSLNSPKIRGFRSGQRHRRSVAAAVEQSGGIFPDLATLLPLLPVLRPSIRPHLALTLQSSILPVTAWRASASKIHSPLPGIPEGFCLIVNRNANPGLPAYFAFRLFRELFLDVILVVRIQPIYSLVLSRFDFRSAGFLLSRLRRAWRTTPRSRRMVNQSSKKPASFAFGR